VQVYSSSQHAEQLLEQARIAGANVHQADEVTQYIVSNPVSQAVLLSAIQVARRNVGTGPQLSLEVYRDPESSARKLTLYVRSHHYSDDFFPRVLAAADELGAVQNENDDGILIATDFQPPR
jgi:hypothetical protein